MNPTQQLARLRSLPDILLRMAIRGTLSSREPIVAAQKRAK